MNTIAFAEYELRRYTAQMGIYPEVELGVDETLFDPSRFRNFDPSLDDAFKIEVVNNKGQIRATNPRAVLMGVYHFLKSQGCRFLRPGKDGEYVPLIAHTKDCTETVYAKYRHRGTTNWAMRSGMDCTFDYLDWLPKVMMNTYMIEYVDYYQSILGTYRFKENPYKQEKAITRELYDRWDKEITAEIQKRGLIRHGGGHGFTGMMMEGITETKNEFHIADTKDETKCLNTEILAQVNGKRELFHGVPLNTNLCLSQEQVRRQFAQNVYECAKAHPEIDYLHVWLADSFSNYCECEACRKLNQSDWYVMLMNEIDRVLTENHSKQKIVFLVYFELLYPPKQERIRNKDRFVMLFCPFGRDFRKSYAEYVPREYTPALNQFTWDDMNGDLYLAQLRDWKKVFDGECIVFDYSLYDATNHLDLTKLNQTAVTVADTLHLEKLGLDGKIECGNIFTLSPVGLMLNGIAQGLFYGTKISEKEHFLDAFGPNEAAYELLYSIKDVPPYAYLKGDTKELSSQEIQELKVALARVREFRNGLYEFLPENMFHRKSYAFLLYYLEIIQFVFEVIEEKVDNRLNKDCQEYVERLRELVFRVEALMPAYFSGIDCFDYLCGFFKQLGKVE